MEVDQKSQETPIDNHSLLYFKEILKKEGFIIDEGKAEEFQSFLLSDKHKKGRSPIKQICYHC